MPVIVEFSRDSHLPGGIAQTFGPYRTVQISGDAVYVFDGLQPFPLARRTASAAWEVNGLDGLLFKSVLIMPPLDQAREDLDRAGEDLDREDPG